MTKKKKYRFPDGGKLPTYTTGTPEYQQYITKQKQYEENKAKHDALLTKGFANQTIADQAITANLNQQFGITPSGWYRYDAPVNSGVDPGFSEIYSHDISGKQYSYMPYYDSPGEATIVKPESEIKAEQLRSQYQGEVHEVVYNPQTGQNEVVKKQIPVGADITDYVGSGKYFAYASGGYLPIYANGGNISSKIGDSFKIAGDTLLSTIGLSDVIGDQTYKNQSFADASRVAETVGKYAGQIGANIIAPGIGGAVMNTVQNTASTLDGDDERRAYMNNIASLQSQNQFGKFNSAAYSTPQNLNTINAVTTGIGQTATGLQGSGTIDNIMSSMKDFSLPTFPFGGKHEAGFTLRPNQYGNQNYFDWMQRQAGIVNNNIPMELFNKDGMQKVGLLESMQRAMQVNKNTRQEDRDFQRVKLNAFVNRNPNEAPTFADGGFIEYNGPNHSNGGVPIDQNGNPTDQQNAVAEVEGGESMHDDGIDKYIFSDRLMVDPKEKVTFADASKKINNKYKDAETDKFQKEARDLELNRLKLEQEAFKQSMMLQQSQQPIMAYGGKMKYPDGGNYGFVPYSPEYLDSQINPSIPQLIPEANFDNFNLNYTIPETFGTSNKSYKPINENVESGLPQDKINPLGYAASNIGNIYDLYQSNKPAKVNKFGYVDLDNIDLSAQRRELEKQSGLQKATNREAVRSTATSSGQALTNQIIGNALATSALGSGLSQSYLNEATANTEIGNQEKLTNAQIKQQEILADQMDLAKRQSTTSQALHSIGMNTQGFTRDLKSAQVGNTNNQMWFDAIKNGKYTKLGFDADGKQVIMLQDGRIISQP